MPGGRRRLLSRIDGVLVGDFVMSSKTKRYVALTSLLLACVCGGLTYTTDGWPFDRTISILPGLLSMLSATALISALYARRIAPLPQTVFQIVTLVLNATVTAMLIEALIGGGSATIFSGSMPAVVGAAIALTWLGMRPLAPVAWGLVLLIGVINIGIVSDAMGIWGYLFVISIMLGILLQFDYDLPRVMHEVKLDFVGPSDGAALGQGPAHRRLGQDVDRG